MGMGPVSPVPPATELTQTLPMIDGIDIAGLS